MKYKIYFLVLTFLMAANLQSQELKPVLANFDTFLNEVFINEGKLKPETIQYSYFRDLFQNRLVYKKLNDDISKKKEFKLLSEITLNDAYNSNLVRDKNFNPITFNPFKYNINFYSKQIQVIKLENTDYVMVIYPQVISSLNRP
jgi:hypothetical protein